MDIIGRRYRGGNWSPFVPTLIVVSLFAGTFVFMEADQFRAVQLPNGTSGDGLMFLVIMIYLLLLFAGVVACNAYLVLFYHARWFADILRQEDVDRELKRIACQLQDIFDSEMAVLVDIKQNPDDSALQKKLQKIQKEKRQKKKEFWKCVGYARNWYFAVHERIANYLPIEEEHPTPFEVPEVHEESV